MMQLYITDVDHTLIRSDKTLSDYSRMIINQLYDHDILFTVATARSIYSLRPMLGDIKLHLPIIEFNGSYITDYYSQKHLHTWYLDPKVYEQLLDLGDSLDLVPFISSSDDHKDHLTVPEIKNKGMHWYLENRKKAKDQRIRYTPPRDTERIVSLTFIGAKEDLGELQYRLTQDPNLGQLSLNFYENQYSPGWHWLSINHSEATKANTISFLQKQHNLQDYELTVFGDNVNDISMMSYADRAIAVENAIEEVKTLSDQVIGHHNSDSVMRFIAQENNL